MKINQKFAKKAMVAASLTAGVIGFNSIFNEAQASGSPSGKSITAVKCTDNNGNQTGWGNGCVNGSSSCVPNPCG
jgi:hypothetical protein